MGDTDKQSQEEMEGDGCVTTASSSTAPTTSSTPRSSTPTGTQPNAIPLGNITSDRQAVQVIPHRDQRYTILNKWYHTMLMYPVLSNTEKE